MTSHKMLLAFFASLAIIETSAVDFYAYKAEPQHFDPIAKYSYQYAVKDDHTGDIKSQKETREGDSVRGYYTLIQPDGRRRIVEYSSDKKTGFVANVRYEQTGKTGLAVFPLNHKPSPKYEPQTVENEPETVKYEPQPIKYEPQTVKYEPQNVKYEPQPIKYEPQTMKYEPLAIKYLGNTFEDSSTKQDDFKFEISKFELPKFDAFKHGAVKVEIPEFKELKLAPITYEFANFEAPIENKFESPKIDFSKYVKANTIEVPKVAELKVNPSFSDIFASTDFNTPYFTYKL